MIARMYKVGNIAVFGLGLSGVATLSAAAAIASHVYAWDDNACRRNAVEENDRLSVVELSAELLSKCDLLISAPGVPDDHEIIKLARNHGIEVICDIELWHRMYPDTKTIGITGTNGKSTLTSMVHHILSLNGIKVQMGGNIGTAIFDLAPPQDNEWIVLELSSFQIERCPTFRPTLSALLNITPDHLDRHETMDRYAAIKASLFEGVGGAVIAVDDSWTEQIAQMVQVAKLRQLTRVKTNGSAKEQNEELAVNISTCVGVLESDAKRALESYISLPHRQQIVANLNGVAFINDSKATNVQATASALQSLDDVVWIVGGALKDGGLSGLEPYIHRIAYACVIGGDMDICHEWLHKNNIEHKLCGDMSAAVKHAFVMVKTLNAATVLLSPASASYDQYQNFMQRGDDFSVCVNELIEQESI